MKAWFYISMIAVFLSACGPTFKIKGVQLTPGINLQQYHTYDFYQISAKGDTAHLSFNMRVNAIKNAVANEMDKRGFKKINSNPDLLINIGIISKEQIQTKTTTFGQDGPYYMGQRNYQWKTSDQEIGRYKDGTATVHLVDAKQNKLVWRGSVQGVIPDRELLIEDAIKQAIVKLFTKFPVAIK